MDEPVEQVINAPGGLADLAETEFLETESARFAYRCSYALSRDWFGIFLVSFLGSEKTVSGDFAGLRTRQGRSTRVRVR